MKLRFSSNMSRLKKKLLLYFILIAIVSISVSAEIILELSTPSFKQSIEKNFFSQLEKKIPKNEISYIQENMNRDEVFRPLSNFRNRMILLLLVVSISIIGAFFMFTKDIVSPMDGMVEATKKIADGDLTVTVPVMSGDEIGQVAGLINDMNVNLQDMIMQIRQEINKHMRQIIKASYKIGELMDGKMARNIIKEKKMRVSDFRKIMMFGKDLVHILDAMSEELFALQKFVNMYKIYKTQSEISQDEIERAIKNYTHDIWI